MFGINVTLDTTPVPIDHTAWYWILILSLSILIFFACIFPFIYYAAIDMREKNKEKSLPTGEYNLNLGNLVDDVAS